MSYKAIVIGGSAGSFQVVTKLLASLPENFDIPILLSLHRLKHIRTGFDEALSIKSKLPVVEPFDKDIIESGKVYLAPANYHMYANIGNTIALSTEEPVNHSRPSIDLSFYSAAYIYKERLVGVLLSGANKDGAWGMEQIRKYGGLTIVQDPDDCQVRTMTSAAMQQTSIDKVLSAEEIIEFIVNLSQF